MPTKAELEARVQELEHNVRRLDRALNQAQLDLGSESEQKRLVFHPIKKWTVRLVWSFRGLLLGYER
jgi:hypothetical protein